MRQLPGLRRLWSPYHVAVPAGVATAPTLLARLARALFDPALRATTTALSPRGARCSRPGCRASKIPRSAARSACCWATISARCGCSSTPRPMSSSRSIATTVSACGISARTRPPPARSLDLAVDAVRIEQQEKPDQATLHPDVLEDEGTLGRARPVAPDQRGIVIAKYPEWDRAHGIERPEWTTVREVAAAARRSAPGRRSARPRRRPAQPDPTAGPRRPGRPDDPAEPPARRPRSRRRRRARRRDCAAHCVRSPTRACSAPPPRSIAILRSCCCSTFRNRPATGSRPAPPFSTSSVWRSRFSPKP